MRIGLPFGKDKHKRIKLGLSMFIDDKGGITSIAFASALLVCLALVFALVSVAWVSSRAYKTQSIADAASMAGENVVAKYTTIAQVIDASILSLGLSGLLCVGAGLVASCVPGLASAGSKLCDAGFKTLEARKKFATSACEGLEETEKMLPVFAAMAASSCIQKNSTDAGNFVGSALLFPAQSQSDFGHLNSDVSSDELKEQSELLQQIAKQIEELQSKAETSKKRAWEADCGGGPYSMRERAEHLAGLSGDINPSIPSPTSWTFGIALKRARAYYRARYDQEIVNGSTAEELRDSAIRKAFYNFAFTELSKGFYKETADGEVEMNLPRLPHNLEETKKADLYLKPIWPCTYENGEKTIHAHRSCPGATGENAGFASLQDLDSGAVHECQHCHFTSSDVGRVASASTNIDNGFEYYWKIVVEESEVYESSRQQIKDLRKKLSEAADKSTGIFQKALDALKVARPRLCPPGAWGCISFVRRGGSSPEFQGSLGTLEQSVFLPEGYAISGATLAPDSSSTNNVLSSFFDQVERRGGFIGQTIDKVMSLWGSLLISYGDGVTSWSSKLSEFLDNVDGITGGSVGSKLQSALKQIVIDAGLEPSDLRQMKPVLVNTESVLKQAGFEKESTIRELVQKIPNTSDPIALARSLGAFSLQYLPDKITIAKLTIPVIDIEIPLEIDVKKVFGGI